MLKFRNFEKGYHGFPVLKIDDLEIGHGVYWIKGGNGSGKSTLLKAVAGILHFNGDILLDQVIDIKKQTMSYRRLVNFAEAEPIFPEFLTGKEMMLMFSKAKGAEKGEIDHYIESMNMQLYIDKPLGTYSSGMLKKLSLALAFLGKPKLILLDEPLITIDTASLEILCGWISEKYEQGQCSFIMASHQTLYDLRLPVFQEMKIEEQELKFI